MLDANISIGSTLKNIRENKQFSLKLVAGHTAINFTTLSRIENGTRLPTKTQIKQLSLFYEYNEKELLKHLISDKILYEIKDEELGLEALQLAEQKIKYTPTLFPEYDIVEELKLESRRYIGNKAKLANWIVDIIRKETETGGTLIDIFAGSGSISKYASTFYEKIIINDFLYANQSIYHAFFASRKWDKSKISKLIRTYNELCIEELEENYFSENFGGKFFEHGIAKKIGYIREDIESRKEKLNQKEYNILLASLIYSIDRVANTVGHFDAYIKKPIPKKPFKFRLIKTFDIKNIEIYRKDANQLAKKIKGDIAYIDPPYNSRQYSRFYHLYETLIKWDKPKLYGVALKPETENMSKYCTVKAKNTLENLVKNLNVKYLAVSYNNTYQSKSKSSANKIQLEEIKDILCRVGKTKIFERPHKYFNTGKTDFNDHKEFLFLTKKYE